MSLWNSAIAYFQTNRDLAQWAADNLADFDTLDPAELTTFSNLFAYEGFDPIRIVNILRRYHVAAGGTPQVTLNMNVNGTPLVFHNHESFKKDMMVLMLMFAARGSSWQKVQDKSNLHCVDLMNLLAEKYHVDRNIHAAGQSLPADTITLPRIASCFPTLLGQIYHKGRGKLLFMPGDVGLPNTITKSVLTPYVISSIPHQELAAARAHQLFFLIHVKTDCVLHSKTRQYTNPKQMVVYYKAALNTPCVPEPMKVSFCTSVSIYGNTPRTFCDDILNAIRGAETRIRDLLPDSPDLRDALAEIEALNGPAPA